MPKTGHAHDDEFTFVGDEERYYPSLALTAVPGGVYALPEPPDYRFVSSVSKVADGGQEKVDVVAETA